MLRAQGGPLHLGMPMGALKQVWKRMGIKKTLKKLLKERKFDIQVERAILVANRALVLKGMLATEKWIKDKVYVEELPGLPVHNPHRAMDFLLSTEEPLAVTREGIPVRCWVWPSNTTDMSVIKQLLRA